MIETCTRSQELWTEARALMPGGVNSPVRAFKAVGGDPVFIVKGKGAHLWDEDGNSYIDYVGAWGPAILGHAHPAVVKALQRAAEDGFAFGAPTAAENQLVLALQEAMPSLERVRLVNSGTEAVMSAIRLARAYTGRSKIVKFAGCYHGHADSLLVKAGSGVATLGLPDSPGVLAPAVAATLALPYNDLGAVASAFAANPGEIAAVLLEPVVGNAGVIPPIDGYLAGLRELCSRHGALLIFDEVMTGFRVARGGAQGRFGVVPDLTCLAKIIAGGVPCGAYGGKAPIMRMVAPEGSVYQAGTMSGNPLATAAGLATLQQLAQPGVYERLELSASALQSGLSAAAAAAGVPMVVQRVGSMLTAFFADKAVVDWESASTCDTKTFARFHRAMLQKGIYLPPSQFESWFVSLAHTDNDIKETMDAARQVLAALR